MKIQYFPGALLFGILALASPSLLPAQEPPPQPATTQTPNARVNVNTAPEAQLRTLPGIGREEARRIITGRPYRNLREMLASTRLRDEVGRALQSRVTFQDVAPRRDAVVPITRTVPVRPGEESPPPKPAPMSSDQKLDVNSAAEEQLIRIGRVPPLRVKRLIQGRPWKRLADLKRIGFSKSDILDLSHYLKVVPQK